MGSYKKILNDISYYLTSKDIDNIKYEEFLIEYPVPNIVKFNWHDILPSPYRNSSNKTIRELELLEQKTNSRSTEDVEMLLLIDASPEYYINQIIDKYRLNSHFEAMREFYNIIKPILLNLKYKFNRPRPYQLAKIYGYDIKIVNTLTHHTPAYPSGHTVYTALYSNILSYYYPEYATLFDQAIDKTAYARVLQGVHYPSDNQASIKLTKFLFDNLYPMVLT